MNPFVYRRITKSGGPYTQPSQFSINVSRTIDLYDILDDEIDTHKEIDIKEVNSEKKIRISNIKEIEAIAQKDHDNSCIVCFEGGSNLLIMTCCKAYFCEECIYSWFKCQSSCPHCRFEDPVFVEVSGKYKV